MPESARETETSTSENTKNRSFDFQAGEVLLVDKPLDWTSFDVVNKIRGILHIKKIGHAGTLDPKATGLLIICTGNKTKSIAEFTGDEKEYEGVMELGAVTPSFDTETEVSERKNCSQLTDKEIYRVARSLEGFQLQTPPMYSALKYGGKPLYSYARKGKTLPRMPREISVTSFDIVKISLPFVNFRIVCSKGTYIRSLVDECGRRLGCGAYVKDLRRTRIGKFRVIDALRIEDLAVLRTSGHPYGSN